MVTTADADCDTSICDVAFTMIVASVGTVDGAVYKPPEVMLPQLDPEQAAPLMLQSTAVLLLPATVARNCCWPSIATTAFVGEMDTTTDGMMVTIADADFVLSASDVAFTVTCGGCGIAPGAVYKPLALIVPQALPLQPEPVRLQLTLVFVVPVTVAVNC